VTSYVLWLDIILYCFILVFLFSSTKSKQTNDSLLCFKLKNVCTKSSVKYFCTFSTDSEVLGRRSLCVNHFAILGLNRKKLYRKWRYTLRTYIPHSKMRLWRKLNNQIVRQEVNTIKAVYFTASYCWVLICFLLKKPCLLNSQPSLRSVHYVNGPHDAFVLSLWATRPQLRAIRPHGHKKGFH